MFVTRINWLEQLPVIKELGLSGKSMADVATHFGVSRQRIKQIVDRYIPDWHTTCGFVVKQRQLETNWKAKWGNKDDTELYKSKRKKFRAKREIAKRTGYEWTITFGELNFPDVCPILGKPLNYFAEFREEFSPSFDRIDNNLGYVSGNVQIISWRANRIKNDGTATEHRKIADYLDSLVAS
jgi:hypothetical protein